MKRVKKALLDSGMTQKELAERAGIDAAALSRIVNGRTVVYHGWASRIAEALGWTGEVEELFEEVAE
jgi:transcriptional regulator with XRE-family HTH domain